MNNVKLEDIIKKYPFMYEIDGELYHIGYGIFKKCTSAFAENYYKNFVKTVNEIDRNRIKPYTLESEEADTLVYYFRKVKSYSDLADSRENIAEENKKAFTFINNLTQETKDDLLKQLEVFVDSFWYYNHRF